MEIWLLGVQRCVYSKVYVYKIYIIPRDHKADGNITYLDSEQSMES